MKTDGSTDNSKDTMAKSQDDKSPFLCGVVEGFYGRPWTTEKRKDLFAKMQRWGMNSYLYAPKDDCKHRAYWRELYTVEEAEHLQSLISLATECQIDFYYAISPGLDITYSNSKEVACLKRKLEQVSQLGCKSFALLFDDIEPEMCKQDKEVFQSFAHAQVSVTNDIFEHLNHPNFLFCPTQYCTARASPTVKNSEYLITLGQKLAPKINIMWTGDKVISKIISCETLQDINDVLRRKVVIWDNEHANDYDQKRVFLGPYSGRSPEVIQALNGVMTNPNCEYGANFVPIHTLAQWSKCKIDGTIPYQGGSDSVTADIKLEIQSAEGGFAEPTNLPPDVYHPKSALVKAIKEWIPEFSKQKTVWGPMVKPQVGLTAPSLIPSATPQSTPTDGNPAEKSNLSQQLSASSSTNSLPPPPMINGAVVNMPIASNLSDVISVGTASSEGGNDGSEAGSTKTIPCPSSILQPISVPVMNSLVAPNKVVVDQTLLDPQCTSTGSLDKDVPMNNPDAPTPALVPPPSLPNAMPPPVAPAIPIPQDIIPGPMYTEPMECSVESHSVPGSPKEQRQANAEAGKDTPMESSNDPPTPGSGMQEEHEGNLHKVESSTMLCDSTETGGVLPVPAMPTKGENFTNNPEVTTMLCEEVCTDIKEVDNPEMTVDDLLLLCQLLYLPAEHGGIGIQLLEDFYWLKRNAASMLPPGTPGVQGAEERHEWEERAAKFKQNVVDIQKLFVKLCACQNRELVYDLYTYLWDMCVVVQTLEGFVQWMSKGACSPKLQNYVLGQQTWFSGLREAFTSGEHEPWMFRGGLVSDLLRLLPLDSGNDLYQYKFPEVPASLLFYVRPFQPKDEAAIYELVAKAYEQTIDAPLGLCESDRQLVGDKMVGAYLTLCPEYTFVCENSLDGSIVGYSCSAPDAKVFFTRYNMAWLPEMRLKYPAPKKTTDPVTDEDMLTPIEQIAQSFHTLDSELSVPECLQRAPNGDLGPSQPWGIAHMLLGNTNDNSLPKRLTMLLLACMRASGTLRMFADIKPFDEAKQKDYYINMGFLTMISDGKENSPVFMTRSF